MYKLKKRWCKYNRNNTSPATDCILLFDSIKERTQVCPRCYTKLKEWNLTIKEYDTMVEQYKEELVSWDKETQTGDVKVTKSETVDIEGRKNTHSQESVFEKTNMDELVAGLEGLTKNKEKIDAQFKQEQSKIEKVKQDIDVMQGSQLFTKELLKIQRDIKNIGMLQEIDKIKSKVDEFKEQIQDLDGKITARNVLLGQIREQ